MVVPIRSSQFLLALALSLACERKPTSTSEGQSQRPQAAARSQPTPSAAPTDPVAPPPPSAATAVLEKPRCLSPAEVAEIAGYDRWRFHLARRVVRVARNDTLALREGPSPSAPEMARLRFDQAGIMPTKKICKVGPTDWYEVRVLGKTGWVNGKYLASVTTVHDTTADYHRLAGDEPAKTPWALADAIVHAMNTPPPQEGRYHAEVVDLQTSGATASAIIYDIGWLDDSIDGRQTLVTMAKTEHGWTVERADTNYLCGRGPDPDNPALCT